MYNINKYADWVINKIDPSNLISYRLYRQHIFSQANTPIKDLSLLGRDLKKIIIIDNIAENFKNQPDNGIFIKSWCGDDNDKILEELSPLLCGMMLYRTGGKESR